MLFCPSFSDSVKPFTLGHDSNNNLYSVPDLHCNNQNRLSNGYGYVWASEISESSGHFQNNLKPTLLAAISYYDVQRWIDQKINAFRSTVSSMINSVVNGARSAINSTINAVSNTARDAYNKATSLAATLSSSVSSALSQAKSYADSAVRVAKSGLDYAINSVRSTATRAYSKAFEVANSVSSKVSSAISTAKSYADSAVNAAKSALNTAINSAKSTASNAYNKAVEVANSVGSKVSSAISTAKSYADSAVNAAKSALNTTINAVKSTANDALSVAQSVGTRFGLFEMNFQRTLSEKFKFFTDFISGINTKINDVVQPLLKPFKDFAKGINKTVTDIINPIIKPLQDAFKGISTTVNNAVKIAVKPFNDFINSFNDKINGFLKPIIDKINNLPKDLLKQALDQAKNHFKGILDNFKSGIDTIKVTINGILSNINTLNSFKTDTNNRLNNLENSINTFGRLYVTQTSFNSFKSDVDKRIKLLNTAVSSINTDLKSAFQSFNLSIIDMSNKVVNAINSMSVNLSNLLVPINDKLNRVITLLTDLNSENGILSKISKLINNVTLFSKLDSIKSSIDNLAKKDFFEGVEKIFETSVLINKLNDIKNSIDNLAKKGIFDNAIFKALEKFFAANKINEISDTLNKIHDFLLNTLLEIMNTISDNVMYIRFFFDNTFGSLIKIEKLVNSIVNKFDDLIKIVKEIEIPKEQNNTTVNNEAETNIWDVAKEVLKTLQEFIKNPAKILELFFGFLRSLIVPGNLDGLNALKTNFDNNVNRKFSFVGQFKHNFVDIYNSPRTFDDITINGSGLFSGSFTIPLSLINIFAPYVKALANGFLVLAFFQSCYVWYHKKFKLESSD